MLEPRYFQSPIRAEMPAVVFGFPFIAQPGAVARGRLRVGGWLVHLHLVGRIGRVLVRIGFHQQMQAFLGPGQMQLGFTLQDEPVFPAVSHHPRQIHLQHAVVGLLVIAIVAEEPVYACHQTDKVLRPDNRAAHPSHSAPATGGIFGIQVDPGADAGAGAEAGMGADAGMAAESGNRRAAAEPKQGQARKPEWRLLWLRPIPRPRRPPRPQTRERPRPLRSGQRCASRRSHDFQAGNTPVER